MKSQDVASVYIGLGGCLKRYGAFTLFFAVIATGPVSAKPILENAVKLDEVTNAVTTTTDGTTFVGFPHLMGEAGVKVAKIIDGKPVPFPDEKWNGWKKDGDAAHAFVRFNSMRIGPDGNLWIVDVGSPAINESTVSHGPKLLAFDPVSGTLARSIELGRDVLYAKSFIDDLRFNGEQIYVSDAGVPGLIVINLKTGAMRRVLDRQPSTTDQQPMRAVGRVLRGPDGKEVKVHSDQLEVSPDGSLLYYMPCSGPLYRVETKDLADASLSDAELEKRVKLFAKVSTAGGTAIDADGKLYVSDTDHSAILTITPSGEISTLISDPKLHWPDAMWIDKAGYLWVPAAQMDLTPAFNAGKNDVQLPITIFKMKIGAKPSPLDHS